MIYPLVRVFGSIFHTHYRKVGAPRPSNPDFKRLRHTLIGRSKVFHGAKSRGVTMAETTVTSLSNGLRTILKNAPGECYVYGRMLDLKPSAATPPEGYRNWTAEEITNRTKPSTTEQELRRLAGRVLRGRYLESYEQCSRELMAPPYPTATTLETGTTYVHKTTGQRVTINTYGQGVVEHTLQTIAIDNPSDWSECNE